MGAILTRAILNAQGISARQLNHELESGPLRQVCHGAFTRAPKGKPWEEHRLLIEACALRGNWVFSHQSAAEIHGMAAYGCSLKRVHVTVNSSGGGGIRGDMHVHARPLSDGDVVLVNGIRVTSRARTAADLAMSGDHGQALSIVDSARLRVRYPKPDTPAPVTVDELFAAADVLGRRPGLPMFRRAVDESVTNSESAGESRTRAMLIEWRLPTPELQKHYHLDGHHYYTDFTWPGMIGEFDGKEKYKNDKDRLRYEAKRAGDFRSSGVAVVNWYWEDLEDRERIFKILTNEMLRCGVIPSIPLFPG